MGTLLTEDELVKALVPYFQGEILQSRKELEDFLARSVEIIVKAQLRKIIEEIEALYENAQLDDSFEYALSSWLEAAKKETA